MVDIQMHYDLDFPPWVAANVKRAPATFKPGTGMCFGIGCHTLDQARALFGPPATVRAHYRVMADPANKTETEDTYDIYLTYPAEKEGLVVEVKTTVISRLNNQLKYFARGRDGTFLKCGQDVQEDQINAGTKSTDREYRTSWGPDEAAGFAEEPKECDGLLVTSTQVDRKQAQKGKLWEGHVPTLKGDYHGYYRDVARAIRGELPQVVTPENARNCIRIIELARESWKQGRTIAFD
jgi:predicted dehydrogenase